MGETSGHRPLGDLTDDDLVARMAARSSDDRAAHQAFAELFARYHAKVLRWCLRILGEEATAEDACQAIFLELMERADRYDPRRRFGAWLYVITRSRCLNALRQQGRRREDPDAVLAPLLVDESSPLASLEREELRQRIRRVCREKLNEREQQVIHLRYTWELPVAEITRAMGLTNASGARTHLRSAEEKLRRYLKDLATGERS